MSRCTLRYLSLGLGYTLGLVNGCICVSQGGVPTQVFQGKRCQPFPYVSPGTLQRGTATHSSSTLSYLPLKYIRHDTLLNPAKTTSSYQPSPSCFSRGENHFEVYIYVLTFLRRFICGMCSRCRWKINKAPKIWCLTVVYTLFTSPYFRVFSYHTYLTCYLLHLDLSSRNFLRTSFFFFFFLRK